MYATPHEADRALLALCRDIATHLDGFTATHDEATIVLRNDDGVELGAAFRGNPVGDRIAITAFPPTAATAWQRKQLKSKITMATSQGAEAVAHRITRDILPGYLQVLTCVKADIAARAAQHAARDQLSTRIAAILPGAETRTDFGRDGQYTAINVGDQWREPEEPDRLSISILVGINRASVSVKGCDPILTMRIAEAIADFYDRHRIDTDDGEPPTPAGDPGQEA